MFESGSLAWPRPIGWPSCFSSGAASRTCSHVAGDWPIEFQRSWRQMIGAGTK